MEYGMTCRECGKKAIFALQADDDGYVLYLLWCRYRGEPFIPLCGECGIKKLVEFQRRQLEEYNQRGDSDGAAGRQNDKPDSDKPESGLMRLCMKPRYRKPGKNALFIEAEHAATRLSDTILWSGLAISYVMKSLDSPSTLTRQDILQATLVPSCASEAAAKSQEVKNEWQDNWNRRLQCAAGHHPGERMVGLPAQVPGGHMLLGRGLRLAAWRF